jgi:hypothetical protein
MRCKTILLAANSIFCAVALRGEQTVCDLFKDLKAVDTSQLILTGELIISKNAAVHPSKLLVGKSE